MKDEEEKARFISSAEDLPSVRNLRNEAAALNYVGRILKNDEIQETAIRVNDELDRIVDIVDEFYRILGKRNWVYFDALDLDRISEILSRPSPDESERALIAYLKEDGVLRSMLTRLNRFPDMRPRLRLLKKAKRDYLEERYYSSALVTVAAMDGFVNDSFKDNRRGLHARKADEMWADDCAAAIWKGLPSVQQVYTKSVCKRIDDPIYEVYRHAIMHGMATDFDNEVVASKAWCMLFAVCDWVEAKQRPQEKAKKVSEFTQALSIYSEAKKKNAELQKGLANWRSHTVNLSDPSEGDKEVVESCEAFFQAWISKNYGRLGSFFPNIAGRSPGVLAGEARRCYSPHPINGFAIETIERPAVSIAQARVQISSFSRIWVASLRFVRLNGGDPAAEWEQGEWKVMQYATAPFADTADSDGETER